VPTNFGSRACSSPGSGWRRCPRHWWRPCLPCGWASGCSVC